MKNSSPLDVFAITNEAARIRSYEILQEFFPMLKGSLSEVEAVEINEIQDLVSKASRRRFAHGAL